MKKIVAILMTIFLFAGCKKENNNIITIPSKENVFDTSPITSPINSTNLDNYLFREDVQYVDVRDAKGVLQDGYISGFVSIPYYSIIASFNEYEALYKMENIEKDDGSIIYAGQVGGFVPQYEESEDIIKSLFSSNKYIFIVSFSGSESAYVINLLIQLGYNPSLLYNVGGVGGSAGITGYDDIDSNKYFVEGIGNFDISVKYDFYKELTPIE